MTVDLLFRNANRNWANDWRLSCSEETGDRIVLCGSMVCATGALGVVTAEGTAMARHLDQVKDSLELLRQVRAGLANDSTHGLVISKLEGAIARMELLANEGVDDRGRTLEVLRLLGQALAAIPGIERAIQMLRDR